MEQVLRIDWLDHLLFPNGKWRSWQPVVSILAMVEAIVVIFVFAFLPVVLFFSVEKWSSSGLTVLVLTALIVSSSQNIQRLLLYRHLSWLKENRPEAIQKGNDPLPKLLYRRRWALASLTLFTGGLGLAQTLAFEGFDSSTGIPFWTALHWPIILGMMAAILLQFSYLLQVYRNIRAYEEGGQ